MQFVIIRAGNMGCVYGGNLARLRQDVAFFDVWQEYVDRIDREGLRSEGLTGTFRVRIPATTDVHLAPKADVALIAVNAYSTRDAAAAAKQILKDDGYCLTIQNGVGNIEILSEAPGRERVLAGLSFQSGDLAGPGFIRHTNNGPTYLGELDKSRSPRLLQLNGLFEAAGLRYLSPTSSRQFGQSLFSTAASTQFAPLPTCGRDTFAKYRSWMIFRRRLLKRQSPW